MTLSITSQTVLTVTLGVLVLILTYLLFIRIRREKKQLAAIRRMNPAEFSDFLRSNSVEGTIQIIAGKVSELLKSAFGCERIAFLRKQRGFLELNYYHGIRRFNRGDFRLRFTPELNDLMRQGFTPRPVSSLREHLPESFLQILAQHQLDQFFPVFWRENLYGIYFVKSSIETGSESFVLLVASLAQSLSAAYHIKWHEARYEKLLQKTTATGADGAVPASSPGILKLIRHRTTETLVPKLFDSLQRDLGLSRMALVYEAKTRSEPLRLMKYGLSHTLEAPSRQSFVDMLKEVEQNGYRPVDELVTSGHTGAAWASRLKEAGFTSVIPLALSQKNKGLLAVSGEKDAAELAERLAAFQTSAQDLLDNAELFEQMEAMSYTDSLTGLSNLRYFHKRLHEEIDRARRYGRSLALIIFDMDDLKGINDRYGHQAGDAILRRMGQILHSSIRAIDIIARYGGDEFCIIMPEADDATCERFMERLQVKIATSRFALTESGDEVNCTISLGGAVFPEHATDPDRLIYAADMALLKAKEKGRNAFVLYEQILQANQ